MSDDVKGTEKTQQARPKKSAWRRLSKWFGIGLLVVLLVILGATGWIAGTRSGLDFAWSLLAPRLPASMQVADVEGRLTGPLTITGIEVDSTSMHVAIDRIHLEWTVSDLLSATLHVDQLAVSGVDYTAKPTTQAPPPDNGEPFTLPEAIKLPVQVRIDRVAVDDVRVATAPDAQPIVLEHALLKNAHLTADSWRIASLTANGPKFDFSAHAHITPHDGYATRLALDAALRLPDLAPLQTQVRVSGDLDRLMLKQTVAAPYNLQLNATLSDVALDALSSIGIDATLKLDHTRLAAIGDSMPDVAPISTRVHVTGTPRKLELKQTLAAPYNAELAATLKNVLSTPSIDAQLSLEKTQLASIKQDLPKVTLNTNASVSGTLQQLALTLDAHADSDKYGPLTAAARVRYTPQAVTIKQLRLRRPDSPMRLSADGTVALAQGHSMNLDVQWQHMRWPLAGDAAYQSDQGTLSLTGALDDYELTGKLDWQVTGQTEGRLELAGHGDLQSFQLARLDVTGGPGDISARAKVTWAPALDVSAHVEGSHINPGAVVADMPGDFGLVADIRAASKDGAIVAHVDTLSAEGSLRGQPLQLDAQLAYLGDHLRIDKLALDYAQTQAHVSGRLGWRADAALDLQWRIESDGLSTLWPTLGGTLATHGMAQGTVAAPSLDAALTARDVQYGDYSVASVDLDADVDWSGAAQSNVVLDVANAHVAGQALHSLALELIGTPAHHNLSLDIDSSTAQLALALEGGLDKQSNVWDFTLTSLRMAYAELAPWTLAGTASGQVSTQGQSITDACLASGQARLCIDGRHTAQGSDASIRLSDLALAYAQPFLPDNFDVAGALSGTVDARVPADGQPHVEAHLSTTSGRLSLQQNDGETVEVLAFDPASVDASVANGALEASLKLPLAHTGGIHAQVAVEGGTGALTTRPLTGRVRINVAKLDFVSRIVSEVAAIDGRIDGDMRISGTLAAPRVLGDLNLDASRIVLLTPGLELTDVALSAAGHGDAIDINMAAHSGGGKLTLDGRVELGSDGPRVAMAIQGNEFQAANMPMVRAWISPDLKLKMTPQAVHVTGRLTIPKARITPHNLPSAGVTTVSSDTVIVTQQDSLAKAAARAIYANILVQLGDVHIKGFGLETGIEGKLRVTQAPGEPVTGAGKLSLVGGSYRAYGQSLDIQSGTIFFSGGPISNPGLELKAARYPAEDITVGVHVRGSVTQPKITLFSDPSMTQAEILSWLLTGRPLEGGTGGHSNMIAKAALALGSGRANKVLGNLGDALGLDNVGIGSAAGHGAGDAALMLGKYLTPKLYISYGIGIFDSVATLSLRYTLNSHWKLESETSGNATGGDIVYTFER